MQSVSSNESSEASKTITIQVNTIPVNAVDNSKPGYSQIELGKKLLHYSRIGNTDEVQLLISRGAPFTSDWLGMSPLHFAAQSGHFDTVEILLKGGISRDARTKVERTPLHIAAQEGYHDIVTALLNNGADVDARDMLRMTSLHWAVERGFDQCVIKLVERGADVAAVNKFGKTPVLIAIQNNRKDLLTILQNASSYIASKEISGIDSVQEKFLNQIESETAVEKLVCLNTQLEESNNIIIESDIHIEQDETGINSESADLSEISRRLLDEEEIEENPPFLNTSPTLSTSDTPSTSTTTIHSTTDVTNIQNLQFLRAHGITMLPVDDDTNIITSAMESGQTVVLTEAGKLALNSTNPIVKIANKSPLKRKYITLTQQQLQALRAGKLASIGKKISLSPTKLKNLPKTFTVVPQQPKVFTSTKKLFSNVSHFVFGNNSTDILCEGDEEMEDEIATTSSTTVLNSPNNALILAKIEQAKKEAEEYRINMEQKQQEAAEYIKRLNSLSN